MKARYAPQHRAGGRRQTGVDPWAKTDPGLFNGWAIAEPDQLADFTGTVVLPQSQVFGVRR